MKQPISFPINPEMRNDLRQRLLAKPEVFRFDEDADLAAALASWGIAREIGTASDELARFLFNEKNEAVPREDLTGEVIRWGNQWGVRIKASSTQSFEVRIRGFRALCHPGLSENAEGRFHQIVIFPQTVAKITALQDVHLAVVKSWAMKTLFGDFDPKEDLYSTNFWELENNDTLRFASLLSQRTLAFLGTHDLAAHVAGVRKEVWSDLSQKATHVQTGLQRYIGTQRPSIADLVLPYTIGVVLDDLAQPPSYESASHRTMLEVLMRELSQRKLGVPRMLTKFPSTFEKIIQASRNPKTKPAEAQALVRRLMSECGFKDLSMPAKLAEPSQAS